METSLPRFKQYKPLLSSFSIRLCVAVTLGLILLAAVEIYAYKRNLHYSGDALEPAVKLELREGATAEDREYWKEFLQADRVTYHQYVLWRRAPFNGKLISINQDGVRRTMHTRCDDHSFTIWMFGDSVMWGAGTPDAETIPSLVAQDYEKNGMAVCVVNYGEKGWSNTQEMLGLIELLKHATRKPDIIFFYDGGSEAYAAYQNGEADVQSNFELFKTFLDGWRNTQMASFAYLRQTNTYRMLNRIAASSPFHRKEKTPKIGVDVNALSAAVVSNYAQNMGIVNLLAKQYGFRAVFAWYPNLAVGHKERTPYEREVLRLEDEEFPHLGEMYAAVYEKSAALKRDNFYNLENVVDDNKDSLYVGISHMRPEGDRIVADRIFEILRGTRSNPEAGNAAPTSTNN